MPENPSIYKNLSSEEKIEIIFKKYYSTLCRNVYRILKDEDIAEDVVQEVFIKVWEKKDNLQFDEQFIFYLKKSCYHTALNLLSRNTHFNNSEEQKDIVTNVEADGEIKLAELEYAVHFAIEALPEKTRLVFTLSRYENMTYKEIAKQLNISVKAVEKHMGIALQRMRVSLKDHLIHIIVILFNIY